MDRQRLITERQWFRDQLKTTASTMEPEDVIILFRGYCHRNREKCEESIHNLAVALSRIHV